MQADTAAHSGRLDARACATSYITLGLIFGFLFGMGIWQASQKGGDWRITLVTGVAFLLTMLWVGTIRIQFSDSRLSYYTLFTGTRSIALSDIESAETKLISSGKGSTMVLLIHPRQQQEKAQKPMTIKIKLFSREDVGRLFDLLGPKFKSSRQIGVYTDETA